jgi:hypothetical protein
MSAISWLQAGGREDVHLPLRLRGDTRNSELITFSRVSRTFFSMNCLELREMFANLSTQSQINVFVGFSLDADSSPGLLSRLLQPYAKRDLIPDGMWSHRSGKIIHVEIAMEAMPAEMVHLVEGNLRQVVGVRSVTRISRACLLQRLREVHSFAWQPGPA